jgi:mRNA interferase MazF
MQRGEVVLVDLPQAVGISGHEQVGSRPALVVHDDATSANLSVIMIVPMTSSLAARQFPYTILVQPSKQNGLSLPSVLLIFQLRAIDKRRITKKIGVIETDVMSQVSQEMKKMLGLI